MSILIKGMEMPQDKAVAVVIHPDGTAYTAEMFAGVCTEYLSDCTAIPVPPHGKCIDADALIKELTLDDEDDNSGASLLMAIFLEVLKAAPTIIPAEEATKV